LFGETLPLFEEPFEIDRARLSAKLTALASENIFIGTSSWKYEGWIGQIYSRDRYLARGKFSQKRFQAECLSEYASTFPIVCGDFSFYQFPPIGSDSLVPRRLRSSMRSKYRKRSPSIRIRNSLAMATAPARRIHRFWTRCFCEMFSSTC